MHMFTHSLTGLLALVDTLVYKHVSTYSDTQIYLKYHVHVHDSAYEFIAHVNMIAYARSLTFLHTHQHTDTFTPTQWRAWC